jgi:hypothetical protein
MKSITRKSLCVAALLSISGASYASDSPVAVNTEGLSPGLAAKVEAKAQQGHAELRRFIWRTRMIYALDMRSLLRG